MLRKLEIPDLPDALDLIWKVFEQFEVPDYSDEGVQEFKSYIEYQTILEKYKAGRLVFWGYFEEHQLLGVLAMKKQTHVSMLFVHSDHHRKGIGKSLLHRAADECSGCEALTVNSSPYAADFYRSFGFVDTDVECTRNGIRFIPMTYSLK